MFKQAQPTAEQDRHDTDMEFIAKPGVYALLIRAGANQDDVLVTGGCFGFCNSVLNTIRHEGNGQRFGLFWLFLRNIMSKNKYWHLIFVVVGE